MHTMIYLFRAKETGTQVGIMREGRLVHAVKADAVSISELEALYLETMKIGKVEYQ